MPQFTIPPNEFHRINTEGRETSLISKAAFDSFNINVLGLGDVSAESRPTDAIAAVFDLEGIYKFL
jgi:hypothetical protein